MLFSQKAFRCVLINLSFLMIIHSTQLQFYYKKSPSFYNSSLHVSAKDHYHAKAFQNIKVSGYIYIYILKVVDIYIYILKVVDIYIYIHCL
jgi:hypothetical protein